MNERQVKFVEMLERHLAQQVSLRQMRTWLAENIRPIVSRSAGVMMPGMWLELRAYRTIRNHLDDLEDLTISRGPNLDWYWNEVKQILDLLLGNEIYKRTVYWIEYPLGHKRRDCDKWMLSHLEYVESCLPILTAIAQLEGDNEPYLPKSNLMFDIKPLTLQTGGEIIMSQMLDIINDFENLSDNSTRLPEHFNAVDIKIVQLNRLEKLIACFKGKSSYSVSVTFEGFDKFSVTIVI